MDIGNQIKRLRTSNKLTQTELAKRLKVTKSTISAYENGSRLPSYDVLISIAQLFHVSTDNLLGYSSKHTLDVTHLTLDQRNTIHSIISAFELNNILLKKNNSGSESN